MLFVLTNQSKDGVFADFDRLVLRTAKRLSTVLNFSLKLAGGSVKGEDISLAKLVLIVNASKDSNFCRVEGHKLYHFACLEDTT